MHACMHVMYTAHSMGESWAKLGVTACVTDAVCINGTLLKGLFINGINRCVCVYVRVLQLL